MKMKKYFLLALVVLTGIASSCKYDDDEVWDSVNNLADRVTSLEAMTKQMNSDIVAMQGIVNAMQKGLTITEVEELADGYILHFSDGTQATIKNGADGKDGANGADGKDGADGENGKDGKDGKDAPVVGVAQDNGVYYWTMTIDGKTDWLTDEDGNKMPVSGADGEDGKDGSSSTGSTGAAGKDGVTPVVTIVNGYWYINGKTTGVLAEGKNGQNGDSMFQSIVKQGDVLVITLTENKVYELPLAASVSYKIGADELTGNVVTLAPGAKVTLKYEVAQMSSPSVEVIKAEGVSVTVDESKKELLIEASASTEPGKIVILYYNANQTITSALTVNISTEVAGTDDLQTALSKGGTVVLSGDMTVAQTLTISKDVVLDLGGKTLTGCFEVTSGSFTVKNGKIVTDAGQEDAISIKGASEGDVIVVNVESTAELEAADCCIVAPNTNKSKNITINTAGILTAKGEYNAIQLNGNAKGNLNVTGGKITSSDGDAAAIYFPCDGTLSISAGEITGSTAVYIKSGNLNITGGTFTGNGEKKQYEYNGNGCHTTGDALVIDNCNYPTNLGTLSVSGGTFTSTYANAVGSYCGNSATEIKTGFITGGIFSDPSACYYLGENADVTIEMTANYNGGGFKTESGQKVTLNMGDNVVYTAVAPLVGSIGTQNLGFQFKKGSTVSIKGGKITSSDAKMLINNYANLTLESVELIAIIPNTMGNQAYYVLSNNCGTVNINSGTVITAPTSSDENQKVFAFDVCKYASYPNVTVNVNDGATINGNVEYTGQLEDDNTTTKQLLNVKSGATIKGNLVVAELNKAAAAVGVKVDANAKITGKGW